MNIEYLSFLVEKGEIKNKTVLDFYRKIVNNRLDYLNKEYNWTKNSSQRHLMAKWPGYHEDIPRLKQIWEQKP